MVITIQKFQQMQSYKNEVIKATIDGTEMFVPLDLNNRHYAEIVRQVKEEGLTIKDAD